MALHARPHAGPAHPLASARSPKPLPHSLWTPPRLPLKSLVNPRLRCSRRARQGRPLQPPQCASYLEAPGLSPPLKPKDGSWVGRLSRAAVHAVPFLSSKELLRRIAVTFVLLALARAGHFLPMPGVDLAAAAGAGAAARLTGMHELPGNIFQLSITPFVSAHFTLGILTVIGLPGLSPHLVSLREQGRPGREQLQIYVAGLFTLFALTEAISQAKALAAFAAVKPAGWAFTLSTVVGLMAGATIVKHLIQCLDQWGLGDGTGLLIGLGIAVNYSQFLSALLPELPAMLLAPGGALRLLCCTALCFGLVTAFLWAQGVELRLPLVFFGSKRSQVSRDHPVLQQLETGPIGRPSHSGWHWGGGPGPHPGPGPGPGLPPETAGGASAAGLAAGAAAAAGGAGGAGGGEWQQQQPRQSYFPLRLAPHGARQLLFANFLVGALLDPVLRFLKLGWLIPTLHTPWAFALVVYAQEVLSIADTTPKQLAEYLSLCQMGIRGLSPGEDTQNFLAERRRQLRHLSGALMALASLAAHAVDWACQRLLGVPLGALSLLLLASTAAGMARQVSAHLKGPQIERLITQEMELLGATA